MLEAYEAVQKVLSPNEFPREAQKFFVFSLLLSLFYRFTFDYLRS